MKDLFYTILVAWIVWRIYKSVTAYQSRQHTNSNASGKPGETRVESVPSAKKKMSDSEGEYVDYEEIK